MQHISFVIVLGLLFAIIMRWGFKNLPEEKWQILASVPHYKKDNTTWAGTNFTFYGFFNALAYTFATAILIILLESIYIPLAGVTILIACILGICIPASKIIARIVEKKSETFTVSGASFAGILMTPLIITGLNHITERGMGFSQPLSAVMAALAISYAFGEGIGRLACISFGCCYGKPLSECPQWMQRFMNNACFVFSGQTKKISYSHGLEGRKVFPVQAVTSIIFCASGLVGVYLFLEGLHRTAFLQTIIVTQLWRLLSEMLRADYRGDGKISVYQVLSVLSVGLAIIFCCVFPSISLPEADIRAGLNSLWNAFVIVFLQAIFAYVFIHTGRSRVTASTMMFHVVRDRI
ncbi:MAG: prolipoprotein diacylglyceryl transferase [Desulfobacteraceae bacterium]|nr:MAG: prolipoprotein diacylglyceryl transferase [Desulfobacteraceae bacterium]